MATEILIEPVFENEELLEAFPEFSRVAFTLIAKSGASSSFKLKLSQTGGETVEQIKIKKMRVLSKDIRYEVTFGKDFVVHFPPGETEILLQTSYKIVFPVPGVYWLELKVEPESVETKQRMLNGGVGRGWSKGEEKNSLRQPILVIDGVNLEQIKINRDLRYLTYAILALTVVSVITMLLSFLF